MGALPMWGRVLVWLGVALACAAGVRWVVGSYEAWRDEIATTNYQAGDKAGAARVQGRWDADTIKRGEALVKAVDAARKEEQGKADAAVKGERHARQQAEARAARNLADAQRAGGAADRLSGDIASLNGAARAADLPAAAACAGQFVEQRNAAIRARELLGSCQQEYRKLAADADSAVAGVQLKLATAMSYVNAVATPP